MAYTQGEGKTRLCNGSWALILAQDLFGHLFSSSLRLKPRALRASVIKPLLSCRAAEKDAGGYRHRLERETHWWNPNRC